MLDLVTDSFPSEPALDIALSGALLRQVGAGRRGATLRIYQPGPTVAFGRVDAHSSGFRVACEVARDLSFAPVVRSVGGHAAAYDHGSVVVEHVTFEDGAIAGIEPRFRAQSHRLASALTHIGADARIGELAGEYCPGAHSINIAGRHKVVGISQRTIRNAALTSAIIVVARAGWVRAVIEGVYAALEIPIDSATVGALDDTLPDASVEAVQRAVEDAYGVTCALRPRELDAELEREARALLPLHRR